MPPKGGYPEAAKIGRRRNSFSELSESGSAWIRIHFALLDPGGENNDRKNQANWYR